MNRLLNTLAITLLSALGLAACGGGQSFDSTKPVNVIVREVSSAANKSFITAFDVLVVGEDGSTNDASTKTSIVVNRSNIMKSAVDSDVQAIGYITLGTLSDTIKALDIDGAKPTEDNVRNGSYHMSWPLNLATKANAPDVAKDFIAFAISAEGQAIVGEEFIASGISAAAYSSTKPAGKIVVGGAYGMVPLIEKLKEAYATINPNATIGIEIRDATAEAGIEHVTSGLCQIALVDRPLTKDEQTTFTAVPVGWDGVAVVVNKENPVTGLSKAQVKSAFIGEALTWEDISKYNAAVK